MKRALMLSLLLQLLCAGAAQAHKASDAYLILEADAMGLSQRVDIALRDLDRELQLDADENGQLSWGELRARAAEIDQLARQGLGLTLTDADGGRCTPEALAPLQIETRSDGRYAVLQRRWQCRAPAQDLTLSYRLFADSDPTHRGVLSLRGPAGAAQTLVLAPDGQATQLRLGAPLGLLSLLRDGVHHIWIGLDHILFLLALLLPAVLVREKNGSWRPATHLKPVLLDVLGLVSAFTLAHSITLALAAFEIVNPPARWVESLIAASVLVAALNNLWPVLLHGRWRLTLVFGLVHGFGFASALKELGLRREALAAPLVMFNLGVELGQLAVVAAFFALAWGLRHRRVFYPRWVLGSGSAMIALLALAWLAERSLDLQLLGV
ncbi:HupE/UreJ family protein [Paucibacter soli]|uniref:HupE/UreJ family protein n=1 Tax=Paucibacter soli TaxID=3133433 RepID=UPI0030B5C0C0